MKYIHIHMQFGIDVGYIYNIYAWVTQFMSANEPDFTPFLAESLAHPEMMEIIKIGFLGLLSKRRGLS